MKKTRDVTVKVRMRSAEKKALQRFAMENDMTVSEIVRRNLREQYGITRNNCNSSVTASNSQRDYNRALDDARKEK